MRSFILYIPLCALFVDISTMQMCGLHPQPFLKACGRDDDVWWHLGEERCLQMSLPPHLIPHFTEALIF